MLRKGYSVTAGKGTGIGDYPETAYGDKLKFTRLTTYKKAETAQKNLANRMVKEVGAGGAGRFFIGLDWANKNYGHWFVAEVNNGIVEYFEPQENRRLTAFSVSVRLARADLSSIDYGRVDELEPTSEADQFVERRRM